MAVTEPGRGMHDAGASPPASSSSSSGGEWDADLAAASEAESSPPAKGGRGGRTASKRRRTGACVADGDVVCVSTTDIEHAGEPSLAGPSPPDSALPKVTAPESRKEGIVGGGPCPSHAL